jgi:hypothetical protein
MLPILGAGQRGYNENHEFYSCRTPIKLREQGHAATCARSCARKPYAGVVIEALSPII